jgi:carbamoyltransferase
VDGTARPQLIEESSNPRYYKILHEYFKLTGIPSLINTSFNLHEEPIVCSPSDALRAFQEGGLDFLVLGNYLLKHPGLSTYRDCEKKQPLPESNHAGQ